MRQNQCQRAGAAGTRTLAVIFLAHLHEQAFLSGVDQHSHGAEGDAGNSAAKRRSSASRLMKSANIPNAEIEDLHFHDLRHTAATRMAETGAEPSTIKDILGDSDLRMTDRYTHAVESRKRAAHDHLADYGNSDEVVSPEERREERRQA